MGTMSTAPLILPFQGVRPRIHESAYIAPGATIIGDVEIGADSSVFYGCVLRGDVGPIRIGERTNIQDNSVLHANHDSPCVLGSDVTVGHKALVHGCEIGDGVLVGMSATILSGARVGSGSLIAAGGVVLENQEIPAASLAAGIPAKVRREMSEQAQQGLVEHAGRYVEIAKGQPDPSEAIELAEVRFR